MPPGSARASAGLPRKLASVPTHRRAATVLDVVREQTASVLGRETAASVDPECTFKDLGLDSLTAVALRNRLAQVTRLRLASTLIFDYPTPAAVADYLLRELSAPPAAEVAGGEREIRRMLAAVPIARLRDAGLLERIAELAADTGAEPAPNAAPTELAAIDEMDVDDLVRMTFQDHDIAIET
jgi:acyl carrier protein